VRAARTTDRLRRPSTRRQHVARVWGARGVCARHAAASASRCCINTLASRVSDYDQRQIRPRSQPFDVGCLGSPGPLSCGRTHWLSSRSSLVISDVPPHSRPPRPSCLYEQSRATVVSDDDHLGHLGHLCQVAQQSRPLPATGTTLHGMIDDTADLSRQRAARRSCEVTACATRLRRTSPLRHC
jgi:hypothetical protein